MPCLSVSIVTAKSVDITQNSLGVFVENLRDGFEFDPILVQVFENPELSESSSTAKEQSKYRILDGAHRWSAYKKTGQCETMKIELLEERIDLIFSLT